MNSKTPMSQETEDRVAFLGLRRVCEMLERERNEARAAVARLEEQNRELTARAAAHPEAP